MVSKMKKLFPDTSVILSGIFTQYVKEEAKKSEDIIIYLSNTVIAEIENLANKKQEVGFTGLRELKELNSLTKYLPAEVKIVGQRPSLELIRLARSGELDAIIRSEALQNDAILVTSDRIQADLMKVEGGEVIFFPRKKIEGAKIEDFFIEANVMSVHLKHGCKPLLKQGKPGKWELVELEDHEPLDIKTLNKIAEDIIERARSVENAFIEIQATGCSVIQLQDLRIVITRPPFSEAMEITAVRPIVRLTLEDYHLPEKLLKRLEKAEGILLSGSPGAGKSTFAQAIAEFYVKKGKIVKTLEQPRDLQVPPIVTQYSPLEGDMRRTADILLLVRPDNVIYDELRDNLDFKAYTDLRMAGVGMLGVIHATSPIDAIQRFITRVELGIIPQIIDTILFMEGGEITQVLSLEMTVKVPAGMKEADLARPVIIVKDFLSDQPQYEIYVFGEQTVVMPLAAVSKLIEENENISAKKQQLLSELNKLTTYFTVIEALDAQGTEFNIYADEEDRPHIVGKNGATITQLEEKTQARLHVRNLDELPAYLGIIPPKKIPKTRKKMLTSKKMASILGEIKNQGTLTLENIHTTRKNIIITIDPPLPSIDIEILTANNELVYSGRTNKNGEIKLAKKSSHAKKILKKLNEGEKLYWNAYTM